MDPKVAKCLLVSKVLVADGIMTENERMFLDRLMKKLELDADMRKTVIDLDGLDEAETVCAKLSTDEKQEMVNLLIDAASADGRYGRLEAAVVQHLTNTLGLS